MPDYTLTIDGQKQRLKWDGPAPPTDADIEQIVRQYHGGSPKSFKNPASTITGLGSPSLKEVPFDRPAPKTSSMRAATADETALIRKATAERDKRVMDPTRNYDPADPLGYAHALAAKEGGIQGFARANLAGAVDPRMLAFSALTGGATNLAKIAALSKYGMAGRTAARAIPKVVGGVGGLAGAGTMVPQVVDAVEKKDYARAGAAGVAGLALGALGGLSLRGLRKPPVIDDAALAKLNAAEPSVPPAPRPNTKSFRTKPQLEGEPTETDLAKADALIEKAYAESIPQWDILDETGTKVVATGGEPLAAVAMAKGRKVRPSTNATNGAGAKAVPAPESGAGTAGTSQPPAPVEQVAQPSASKPAPTTPEWVRNNIDALAVPAEKSGIASKIEALSAKRKTAAQVAKELGIEQDVVRAVRAKRGIPSMDDAAEFDSWLAGRNPDVAPSPATTEPVVSPKPQQAPASPKVIAPSKAVVRQAKAEKVSKATGMTPTQEQFLANGLRRVAGNPENVKPFEQPVTIKVPDDGQFTVKTPVQAANLHKSVTGEAIPGWEGQTETVKATNMTPPPRFSPVDKIDEKWLVEKYGGLDEAVTGLEKQIGTADPTGTAKDLTPARNMLSALKSRQFQLSPAGRYLEEYGRYAERQTGGARQSYVRAYARFLRDGGQEPVQPEQVGPKVGQIIRNDLTRLHNDYFPASQEVAPGPTKPPATPPQERVTPPPAAPSVADIADNLEWVMTDARQKQARIAAEKIAAKLQAGEKVGPGEYNDLPPDVVKTLVQKLRQQLRESTAQSEQKLKQSLKEQGLNAAANPETLARFAEYAAKRGAEVGWDFAAYSQHMLEEFGPTLKPHLKKIWQMAKQGEVRPPLVPPVNVRDKGAKAEGEPNPAAEPTQDPAVLRLQGAMKGLKKLQPEVKKQYHEERSKRAGAAIEQLEKNTGEEAFIRAKQQLGGELPQPDFEPLEVNPADRQALNERIRNYAPWKSFPFQKISTQDALNKILDGSRVPAPHEIDLLEEVFGPDFVKPFKKPNLWKEIVSLANTPKSFMSILDRSMLLRQSLFYTASHPVKSLKTLAKAEKGAWSQKVYEDSLQAIREYPDAKLIDKSGLAIVGLKTRNPKMQMQEEGYINSLVDRIPGLKQVKQNSERAATGFLNQMRADRFTELAAEARKAGVDLEANDFAEAKKIAHVVNVLTGRGRLPQFAERIVPELNAVFFSPRFVASRIQALNPVLYATLPKGARMAVAKDLMRFGATMTTLVAMLKQAGADIESDPRSSDFGKIRDGKTRIDPWGGYQQFVRLIANLWTSESKTIEGEIVEKKRSEVLGRFARSKEGPGASYVHDAMEGSDYIGQPFDFKDMDHQKRELAQRSYSLFVQDMIEAVQEHGAKGGLYSLPAFFGAGTATYQERKDK